MCDNLHIGRCRMATNLAIDDRKIERARELGGYKTKKEAVTAALDEFIQRREQLESIKHFGTIDFRRDFDYRRLRRRLRISSAQCSTSFIESMRAGRDGFSGCSRSSGSPTS